MDLEDAIQATPTAQRRRTDAVLGALVGSRCDNCDATCWPSRAICYRCGAPGMRETAFESKGDLLTHTTVWVERPGLVPPYTLGQVKLEGGPVVFGHVRGLESGSVTPLPVRLVLDADPEQVPPFWFEPRGSSPKTSSFER